MEVLVVDTPVIVGIVVLLLVAVIGLITHAAVTGGNMAKPWTQRRT